MGVLMRGCSNLCKTAERGADGVRRRLRHDQCIPFGLNQSTVLRRRFAKVSGKPSHGLECRSTEPGGQDLAISSIAVPDWVTRDLLPATGFSELIGDPFGKKHCAIRPHLPAGLGFRQGPVNMTTASIQ